MKKWLASKFNRLNGSDKGWLYNVLMYVSLFSAENLKQVAINDLRSIYDAPSAM